MPLLLLVSVSYSIDSLLTFSALPLAATLSGAGRSGTRTAAAGVAGIAGVAFVATHGRQGTKTTVSHDEDNRSYRTRRKQ